MKLNVKAKEMTVKYIDEDLVDKLWKDKPKPSKASVIIHDIKYSGEPTANKLKKIYNIMKGLDCEVLVVSALDQIAWILNLRGSDISFNPYFVSYLMIVLENDTAKAILYSDLDKFKDEKIQKYLTDCDIKVLPYESIMGDVAKLEDKKVGIELNTTNAKLFDTLSKSTVRSIDNRIPILKQKKNPTELNGYRACHIRDGVGLVKYLAWLDHQLNVLNRTDLDEYMAAEKVLEYRKGQEMFMGLSFETISSIGPNGSIVHYSPEKGRCAIVNNKEIYLLDSGAHYL